MHAAELLDKAGETLPDKGYLGRECDVLVAIIPYLRCLHEDIIEIGLFTVSQPCL